MFSFEDSMWTQAFFNATFGENSVFRVFFFTTTGRNLHNIRIYIFPIQETLDEVNT